MRPATENSYYVFLGYWGKCLAIIDEKCSAYTETLNFMTTLGSGHVLVKKLHIFRGRQLNGKYSKKHKKAVFQ